MRGEARPIRTAPAPAVPERGAQSAGGGVRMGAASGDSAVARGAGGAQVAGAPAGTTGGPPTRAGERRAASTISRTPISVRTAPAAITPQARPPSDGTV